MRLYRLQPYLRRPSAPPEMAEDGDLINFAVWPRHRRCQDFSFCTTHCLWPRKRFAKQDEERNPHVRWQSLPIGCDIPSYFTYIRDFSGRDGFTSSAMLKAGITFILLAYGMGDVL